MLTADIDAVLPQSGRPIEIVAILQLGVFRGGVIRPTQAAIRGVECVELAIAAAEINHFN